MDRKFGFDLQLFAETSIDLDSLREQAWAKQSWDCALKDTTISNFVGKGSGSIIQLDDTMKKEAGDQITFKLRMPLTGDGIYGDDVAEGKEEPLEYRDFPVRINQVRKNVRIKGKMAEKKVSTDMRKDAQDALKDWFAEYFETTYFIKLSANPSAHRIILPHGVGGVEAIVEGNTMSCALISKAKRAAEKRITYTKNGIAHILPKLRPVKINGKPMYALILSNEQMRDLRNDPTWIQAQSNANIRGEDNPLFSGAEGIWDGVIIYTNENTVVTSDGSGGTKVGHGLLLGAQAACFAVGSDPDWVEDKFDYQNKIGFCLGQIFGIEKSVYDEEDFGVVHVFSSNVDD